MNLFVLPSWYPSAAVPMAGVFVREQVAALVAAEPSLRVAVGTWGHHDGALSMRSAAASARALRWRLGARAAVRAVDAGGRWQEWLEPRLSWTLAWAGGNARGLLAASRRNLARARAQLGGIDLLHAHVGFPAGWIASVLADETGLPYVLTEHMGPFPVPPLLADGRPVASLVRAFERARAVIAVSPALAAAIRAHGLRCDHVIPNAVDTARFAAAAAAAPTRAPGSPFVLFALGALLPDKGFDVLLDAFARWNPPAAAVRLEIGGDGPERAALEARAVALGLADRVRFLGALAPEAVPTAMARCDAFVLASRRETFGVVLVEALAAGRPVVATRCGGPASIVGPEDGLLVPPGDAAALAAALARMHAEAGHHDAAGLRARAAARFGAAPVAARLLQVYREVLAR